MKAIRVAHWAADLIEVAAVFFAVGTAHLFVTLLGERAHGPQMLAASGVIVIAGALLRRRWKRRTAPVASRHAAMPDLLGFPAARSDLMRVRTTLPDRPGTLAALAERLAGRGINILAIQIHPGERGAVDELLVAVPAELPAAEVVATVAAGGGEATEANRADVHDLVDPATRALTLARHAATGAMSLAGAVHSLLGADLAATRPTGPAHVAVLHDAGGDERYLVRPAPAFTPTEISRAQALMDLYEDDQRRRSSQTRR
ncbi:ACT domain-containing protein [Actinoplanes sp. Pm04-4]|uniref:ACT domain-containing protein n=1 Tax=Paractinoplanes pyxinae TaxID=2997416 RepID=A0ABT4AY55_9ACTN|nr:ACT domain-containing protein [Actinoplanes pyxinae]MCY1139177.1 ACT domain-containing protein [Actinoplanes pyxinae]